MSMLIAKWRLKQPLHQEKHLDSQHHNKTDLYLQQPSMMRNNNVKAMTKNTSMIPTTKTTRMMKLLAMLHNTLALVQNFSLALMKTAVKLLLDDLTWSDTTAFTQTKGESSCYHRSFLPVPPSTPRSLSALVSRQEWRG